MIAQWTGECVGKMHTNRISITQLAQELGVTREYLSMLLNGRRSPAGAEQRVTEALNRLIDKQANPPKKVECCQPSYHSK